MLCANTFFKGSEVDDIELNWRSKDVLRFGWRSFEVFCVEVLRRIPPRSMKWVDQ